MFILLRIGIAFAFAMMAALVCSVTAGTHSVALLERLVFVGSFIGAYLALGNWRVQKFVSTMAGYVATCRPRSR